MESSNTSSYIEDLPKANFLEKLELRKWEGYWLSPPVVKAAIAFQTTFSARDDDVFLASFVKTGTTWLKALLFCITQRHQTLDLLTLESPHSLVPTVEAPASGHSKNVGLYDVHDAAAARLLHTHLPHALLPESVRNSPCKIVYVGRNPKDTLISSWHYYNSFLRRDEEPFPLEKFVDFFCLGIHPFGHFVEHVADYWGESRKRPQKILFLKYEDLKADPKSQVLKIAEFLERPFGDYEGEVDEIVRSCSFERLKNLEVNKSGSHFVHIPNSSFFRKGEVGDWNNYLTPEMGVKIDQTIGLKLEALGLYF